MSGAARCLRPARDADRPPAARPAGASLRSPRSSPSERWLQRRDRAAVRRAGFARAGRCAHRRSSPLYLISPSASPPTRHSPTRIQAVRVLAAGTEDPLLQFRSREAEPLDRRHADVLQGASPASVSHDRAPTGRADVRAWTAGTRSTLRARVLSSGGRRAWPTPPRRDRSRCGAFGRCRRRSPRRSRPSPPTSFRAGIRQLCAREPLRRPATSLGGKDDVDVGGLQEDREPAQRGAGLMAEDGVRILQRGRVHACEVPFPWLQRPPRGAVRVDAAHHGGELPVRTARSECGASPRVSSAIGLGTTSDAA